MQTETEGWVFLFLSSAEVCFHGSSRPVSFLSISRHDAVETHEGSIAYIIISMLFSLSSVKECHSLINVNNSIKKTTSQKIH